MRNDSGRLDRLERMVQELHQALLQRPDAPTVHIADTAANGASTNGAPARRVVVVDGGEMFHRPSCAMVTGKDAEELSQAGAVKRGLRPCPACAPAPASAPVRTAS
jgi:hypothetical protein